MSSTKPEVHNVLQICNAIRERPRHSHRQHAQNVAKFNHVVFEIGLCKLTDRHTHHNTLHPSWGQNNN